MRASIAYVHLLKPLSALSVDCYRYNALTKPYDLKTDSEHERDSAMAQSLYRQLRPYILLGVVKEWDSGRLALSERATNPEAAVAP